MQGGIWRRHAWMESPHVDNNACLSFLAPLRTDSEIHPFLRTPTTPMPAQQCQKFMFWNESLFGSMLLNNVSTIK